MMQRAHLFAAALRRIRLSVLLPLLCGNALVLLSSALGLKIPDSHAWQVLLSMLLGLGIVSAVLLWNTIAMRRLRGVNAPAPLWSGALLFGMWLLFAALLWHVASLGYVDIDTRAGYWNSQLSPATRHALTYGRLVTLQTVAIVAFIWVVVPGLLVPFVLETVTYGLSAKAVSRAVRVLLSLRHWVTAVVTLGLVAWLAPVLIMWHPVHTVTGELVSAALRLSAAAALTVCAILLLLAVDAELLARRENTPASVVTD